MYNNFGRTGASANVSSSNATTSEYSVERVRQERVTERADLKNDIFVDLFLAFPNHYTDPNLTKLAAQQANLRKKRSKKAFF